MDKCLIIVQFLYIFSSPRYNGKHKADHELTVHGLEPVRYENINHQLSSFDAVLQKNSDDAYNYQCNLLDQGLLYMNFVDAIAEGDGNRIIRCWKYLLLHFYAEGKTKYAIEAQYLLLQQHCLLSPRQAFRQRWNRSVNNKGGAGKNVPLDLDLEHDNNYLKESVKKMGHNITTTAVSRACKVLKLSRHLCDNLRKECSVMKKSG